MNYQHLTPDTIPIKAIDSDHVEAQLQAAYAHLAALIQQHKALVGDIAAARQAVDRLEHQAFGLGCQ